MATVRSISLCGSVPVEPRPRTKEKETPGGSGIVQPCAALPPNTGITLVADVAGSTQANDAFWGEKCSLIPSNALFLVLKMGDVVDFFKPADAGTTYCEMLLAHNKHQWSPDGMNWFAVGFGGNSNNGGSAQLWPQVHGGEGDVREYLSFWGHDAGRAGGCCSTSTVVFNTDWSKSFSLSYALPLHPLPPNTGMSLVADVAGTTRADDAFWAEQCKGIPSNTLFIVVDMGTVRDFFKPIDPATTTYCDMLQ
eukprot:gene4476-biopygen24912